MKETAFSVWTSTNVFASMTRVTATQTASTQSGAVRASATLATMAMDSVARTLTSVPPRYIHVTQTQLAETLMAVMRAPANRVSEVTAEAVLM